MILDLSFNLRAHGRLYPSVNESTTGKANPRAMGKLGTVIPRLIQALAKSIENQPVHFAKFDIKDGFWRMVVERGAEWNFCYVLPKLDNTEPTRIVVPQALQMGWVESPPFFCSASETARDVATKLLPIANTLPNHPLKNRTIPSSVQLADPTTPFQRLLEVYVDDFIALIQATTEEQLQITSRAILAGIHSQYSPHRTSQATVGKTRSA